MIDNVNIFFQDDEKKQFREDIKIIFKLPDYQQYFSISTTLNYESMLEYITNLQLSVEKSFFDMNNVYLFPSCITALMTNINIHGNNNTNDELFTRYIKKINDLGFGVILYSKDYSNISVKYNISTEPKKISDLPYYYFCSLVNDFNQTYYNSSNEIFLTFYNGEDYELYQLSVMNSCNKLNKFENNIIINYLINVL